MHSKKIVEENYMEDKLKWLKERQKGIGGSDVGATSGKVHLKYI